MEQEEEYQEPETAEKGYCFLCSGQSTFVPTESPTGYWVCTNCHSKVSKLEKFTDVKIKKEYGIRL